MPFIPPGLTDEQQVYFLKLDEDIQFFVRELWLEIGSEQEDGTGRAPLSEFELDLVANATNAAETIKVILGTRGLGKTYLIAAVAVWRLLRDPCRKIVIACKSETTALKTSLLIRSWLDTVWFLRHLRPTPGRRDNVRSFDVGPSTHDRQASITAIGVGGNLENNRAHTVIADDVETKANTITFEARERLHNQCAEFIHWLYPSIPEADGGSRDPTEIIFTLTPKHEETIARKMEKEGHPIYAYPLCAPLPDEQTFRLAPLVSKRIDEGVYKPGDCLFPKRFKPEDVAIRRRLRSDWLRECQLVRTLGDADRYPLKLSNFIVYDCDGDEAPISLSWGTRNNLGSTAVEGIECAGFGQDRFYAPIHVTATQFAPFTGTKMHIDPAGTGKDKTGYAVVSHLNGFYWLRRLGGLQGGATSENLSTLARIAYETNTSEITIERNFGGDAYRAALEIHVNRLLCRPNERPDKPRGFACLVTTIPVTSAQGHKERRIIDTIEPILSMRRIVIPTTIAGNPEFQTQVSRLSSDRGCLEHDDIVDAIAGCLSAWKYTYAAAPKDPNSVESNEMREWRERIQRKYAKSVSRFTAH